MLYLHIQTYLYICGQVNYVLYCINYKIRITFNLKLKSMTNEYKHYGTKWLLGVIVMLPFQEKSDSADSTITIEENEDDDVDKPEPTHYSKIDLRTIKVEQLRQELRARNVSCKGRMINEDIIIIVLIIIDSFNNGVSHHVLDLKS